MKKEIAVISLDTLAGQFYAQQVRDLFGDRVSVDAYSVRDESVTHMVRRYALYMISTDAFDTVGDLHQYVPIDGEMMEIQVTFRWSVIRQLQALPPGKRALFVNLSQKMCREAGRLRLCARKHRRPCMIRPTAIRSKSTVRPLRPPPA